MEKYVEVFAARDITFAYLMKANLEDAGIPVQIANENLQNMYCIDGMVPRVLVPEKFKEQALQIISEIQNMPEDAIEDDYELWEENYEEDDENLDEGDF
jgi:hypothetical protein